MFTAKVSEKSKSATLKTAVALLSLLFLVIAGPGLLSIDLSQASGDRWHNDRDDDHDNDWKRPRICSQTAQAAFRACGNEVKDDYWIAVGNCKNLSDADERAECLVDAKAEFYAARELCTDQREARLDLCEDLGQAPYDPIIDPEDFVDFEAVIDSGEFTPNRYFPLDPGTVRDYEVTDDEENVIEKIKVEILEETKEILGVNCIVVRDRVWEIDEDGEESLVEDTFDWYAQDVDGNVWYFGEISKEFEDGELVSLEGSWKSGVDGAKPGILMYAYPDTLALDYVPPQEVYRQEFFLGDAEDIGEFVEFLESIVVRGETYHNVLKTKDYTPIEPEVFEYKYYAPGVGVVLEEAFEEDVFTGEKVELVPQS